MKKIVSFALATWMSVASMSAFGFEKNIVDTAVEAGKFQTLAAAFGVARLVQPLKALQGLWAEKGRSA